MMTKHWSHEVEGKLTIYSNYHDYKITTKSEDARYIRRLCNKVRRGDGDWIKIEDEEGKTFDFHDNGQGLELRVSG